MSFSVGNLVRARGREWTVTESKPPWLYLRPLGGQDIETAGINLKLEKVESAEFEMPDSSKIGEPGNMRLLRDAVRFSFSEGAGPFRSFSSLEVEPRSYQLVPLLMALRLDPVRLLIADDVGIGKTIEALLVAKELLVRKEVRGLAVLCPPHLAQQWQREMREKFNIEAALIKTETVNRLERSLIGSHETIFTRYPITVISLDYIKSENRRAEFIRTCPEMVIVDEAHSCAGTGSDRGRQQREELIRDLCGNSERHIILVTATPHSGKAAAFRTLLSFLNNEFTNIPNDLAGNENENIRRKLSKYFVQRRRPDIKKYLDEETVFPERLYRDETYNVSKEYRSFFEKIRLFALENIDAAGSRRDKRVRWWSALSLLRSVSSSPAAAASTLRNRSVLESLSDEKDIRKRSS